jgi:trehalose 6-phosphate phosphatase
MTAPDHGAQHALVLDSAQHALLLDIDGTLLDLAATPGAVIVPEGLPDLLRRVQAGLGGALAILSGRKLADIDFLLGPGLPCAAEHGILMRDAVGNVARTVQRLAHYDHWLKIFQRYADAMPGVLVEEKEFSLVVHYRRAPEHEAELRNLVDRLIGESDDAVLLLAHCAFEVKPRSGNEGDALGIFMDETPFAGRTPVFIGDDTTDEPAIAKANELGGRGLHVARDFGGSTAAVREWLGKQALLF